MKHPRHRLSPDNYRGFGIYFLTLCTGGRHEHFRRTEITRALIEVMHEQFQRLDFSVWAFCFMPDHCHLLVRSEDAHAELPQAVRAFKGVSATAARRFAVHGLWQRDYYEHVVRTNEGIGAIVAYVLQNPVRAGLVKDWREWPFSGTVMFDAKTELLEKQEWKPPRKAKPQRDKPAAT